MSSLVTAEEWASGWLDLAPDIPEAPMVRALLERINFLRDECERSEANRHGAEGELSDLRSDIRKEVDRLVAVRLREVRSSTSALLQAASNFAVAVDEEWR